MKIIYAPNHDTSRDYIPNVSVFLAGGITGCVDWQSEFYDRLVKEAGTAFPGTAFNPRRPQFPMDDPDAAREQIVWEFDKIQECDILVFWFAPETLNPIVLYELGFQMGKTYVGEQYKPIIVGVHPEYQRKQDVEIQMDLAVGHPPHICYSLKELAERTASFMREELDAQSSFRF